MKRKNYMKTKYKDFTLEVKREKCLAGYDLIYYTAIRDVDGWFMIDSFTEGEDPLETIIEDLKFSVDEYYENPSLYDDDLD